eukprot:9457698-Alexandrium_andersonii.AAC.1
MVSLVAPQKATLGRTTGIAALVAASSVRSRLTVPRKAGLSMTAGLMGSAASTRWPSPSARARTTSPLRRPGR